MWTATVADKQLDKRGNLVVSVTFTDGTRSIAEEIATAYGQPGTWLEDRVSVRLKALEAIDAMPVPEVGTVIEKKAGPEPEVIDPEREAYRADVSLVYGYRAAIALGIPLEKDAGYVAAQARLVANFKAEYLAGLF
jgi:hypothetical protein